MSDERRESEAAVCETCGAEVDPATDRAYVFGEDTVVCYAGAIQQSGVYDEAQDRWTRAPELAR